MASESLYQSIFKFSHIPSVLLVPENGSFKIVIANDAFLNTTGLTATVGKELLQLAPQIDHIYTETEKLAFSLEEVKKTKSSHKYRNTSKTWEIENRPVPDEKENLEFIIHSLAPFNDVMENEAPYPMAEQKEYYKSLFSYHPDAVFSLNLNGEFQSANQNVANITGIALDKIYDQHYEPLVAPEDQEKVNQHFQKAVGGEIQNYNCGVINQQGETRILNITNIPIRVKDNIVGVYGIAKDITKEKRNEQKRLLQEEELKKINKKLFKILESITDGFFTVDQNDFVTYWNKEAELILKIPKNSILGKNLWEAYPYLKSTKFYSEYKRSISEHRSVHIEEYYPPLEMWIEAKAYPSDEGVSVYLRDITKEKETEEHIRLSNERYDYLVKVTHDAIWDWDLVNDKVHRSERFHSLFGWSMDDDSFSMATHWTDRLHPEDAERVIQNTKKMLETPDVVLIMEQYRYRKADNTYANILDRGHIIRDDDGNPIRVIGAMQDITYQKKTEQELKELNAALKERAEELASSNSELEKFAYIASHDLKEPLRMITGFLLMLQKKYSQALDETANTYINYAVDGSRRMDKLIKDLLIYSQAGRSEVKKEAVDFHELIEEVKLNLMRQIQENNATITIKGPLPVMAVYKSEISRLFQNIINNAIKFRKPGEAPVITIEAKEGKTHTEFCIKDNGIGMTDQNFQKIFEIFSRLHTKDQYPGSGIGLAICKKIVKQHGGDIWVNSVQGKGSIFHFTLEKS